MAYSDARLAEMLCTRLCHDLTGPIGALSNGAEFLADEDFSMQAQAIELISESAAQAVNRLQFYRAAYGRITQPGEASLSETKKLIANFLQGSKISLDWPDSFTDALNISVSRKLARLILNMTIMACGTMIRGGILSIRIQEEEGKKIIAFSGSGLSIRWDIEQQQALEAQLSDDQIQPATVQLHYTLKLAEELMIDLSAVATDESFELIAIKNEIAGMIE